MCEHQCEPKPIHVIMIKSFPDDFYVININYNNLIDLPRNLLAFFLISILLQPMVCLFL